MGELLGLFVGINLGGMLGRSVGEIKGKSAGLRRGGFLRQICRSSARCNPRDNRWLITRRIGR